MNPQIKAEILRIANQYGGRNVRIFGSFARGEERPDSDIDLLIDLEEGRSLLDLIGIQQDLEDLLGRKVDVATERSLNKYIKAQILADAVLL